MPGRSPHFGIISSILLRAGLVGLAIVLVVLLLVGQESFAIVPLILLVVSPLGLAIVLVVLLHALPTLMIQAVFAAPAFGERFGGFLGLALATLLEAGFGVE